MICNDSFLASIASYITAKTLKVINEQLKIRTLETKSMAKCGKREPVVAARADLEQ